MLYIFQMLNKLLYQKGQYIQNQKITFWCIHGYELYSFYMYSPPLIFVYLKKKDQYNNKFIEWFILSLSIRRLPINTF